MIITVAQTLTPTVSNMDIGFNLILFDFIPFLSFTIVKQCPKRERVLLCVDKREFNFAVKLTDYTLYHTTLQHITTNHTQHNTTQLLT